MSLGALPLSNTPAPAALITRHHHAHGPVDKFGVALSEIFEGVEGCSTARCTPESRRQLKHSDDSTGHQSLRSLATDDRWTFFRTKESASALDASADDELSDASMHEVEQRFGLCSRPSRDRASITKRVSWSSKLCSETGRMLEHDRDPAAPLLPLNPKQLLLSAASDTPKDSAEGQLLQPTCCSSAQGHYEVREVSLGAPRSASLAHESQSDPTIAIFSITLQSPTP